MTFRYAELVGRYRLVVTQALLEFVERAVVEPAPRSERERIRREALDEANRSELSLDPDGTIASRAGDQEFYRVTIAIDGGELEALRYQKPGPSPVTLVLVEPNRLVAHQPHKPPAEFQRIVD